MKRIIKNYWLGWVKCAEIMKQGVYSMNHCAYVPDKKAR